MYYQRNRLRSFCSTIHWRTTGLAALALMGVVLSPAVGHFAIARTQQPTAAAPLVLDRVTVIDVQSGRRILAQRVVIVGNRIRAVGSVSSVHVPAGARVVDARGKYLMPGLWNMHTHSERSTDIFYPLFIANGVTGIRDAWSEVPLDTLIMWRREIVAGTRVGPPRQLLAGPALDEETPCMREKGEGHVCIADSADARHVVDSLKAAGANFIKTYDLKKKETYFAVAAEARRVGIQFGGHLDIRDLGITAIQASDSGASILDHPNTASDLDELCLFKAASVERCQPVAERFRHNGTWWVPTLIILATSYGIEEAPAGRRALAKPAFGPASQAILKRFYQFASKFWEGSAKRLSLTGLRDSVGVAQTAHAITPNSPVDSGGSLRLVHRVGMPILAGTDDAESVMERQPPGFSLHAELATYVGEGLTPLEALQTATLNPAKAIHGTDSLGTVAPGKLADLVLLDADPLADITNTTAIRAVVANGRYFDRAALDQLLTDAQAKTKKNP
jgi:hypothetical protein